MLGTTLSCKRHSSAFFCAPAANSARQRSSTLLVSLRNSRACTCCRRLLFMTFINKCMPCRRHFRAFSQPSLSQLFALHPLSRITGFDGDVYTRQREMHGRRIPSYAAARAGPHVAGTSPAALQLHPRRHRQKQSRTQQQARRQQRAVVTRIAMLALRHLHGRRSNAFTLCS